jgi:hypothetical protein
MTRQPSEKASKQPGALHYPAVRRNPQKQASAKTSKNNRGERNKKEGGADFFCMSPKKGVVVFLICPLRKQINRGHAIASRSFRHFCF